MLSAHDTAVQNSPSLRIPYVDGEVWLGSEVCRLRCGILAHESHLKSHSLSTHTLLDSVVRLPDALRSREADRRFAI